MRFLKLKLILLLHSVPSSDRELQDFLTTFDLLERFTPYITGGRGPIRSEEAREWLEKRRNEAIAELTLLFSAVAMIAAIVAAARCYLASVGPEPRAYMERQKGRREAELTANRRRALEASTTSAGSEE